jgi:hypothetical protein
MTPGSVTGTAARAGAVTRVAAGASLVGTLVGRACSTGAAGEAGWEVWFAGALGVVVCAGEVVLALGTVDDAGVVAVCDPGVVAVADGASGVAACCGCSCI